ncbi:Y-family DNA polymerase [Modicisalibacter sp. 'Wilcox']|uniref:Y-family DNA polymerase n=1 Tax=Modicisalibacter sp. 'Wilcox' TaxID=2679914 RepID=UPI0013D43D11|nr:Y-family DNA polymerase [Modicisalibacter sp. 'Wilcox']
MFGLVDCNNFYVSCERVFQPRLEGTPVGVLSNNDGCVIARSEELKALGVGMGVPAFRLRDLTTRHGAVLLSSNYELYGDMSARVQAVLEELAPGVEPYSIDEMFVRFDGLDADGTLALARRLHRRVRQYTGIPVSVGVAPTRTLAKLANRAAKKEEHDGVCVLTADGPETRALLSRTDLKEIWGVGRRLAERLFLAGIRTAAQLRHAASRAIRRRFGAPLSRTVLELRGIAAIEMNDTAATRQRIMTSRSFGQLIHELGELREAIRQHAQRGAEKLRQQRSLCRAVQVFLRTPPHRVDLPQYAPSLVIEMDHPTDDSRLILQAALAALERIHRRGYRFLKGGVMLLDLIDADHHQLSLLDAPQGDSERRRSEALMATLDRLNRHLGRDTVAFGMPRPGAAWPLRCANRSHRWTTRWAELPVAKVH